MFSRMTITLAEDERLALNRMAAAECRFPKEQIRYLVRQEAERRGLLTQEQHQEDKRDDEPHERAA